MVTCPKLAPSSVDVVSRSKGVSELCGLARTTVVPSELNVEMQPTRPPPARSPAVADET